MGNDFSSPDEEKNRDNKNKKSNGDDNDSSGNGSASGNGNGYKEFLASAGKTIGEASGIVCGSLDDIDDDRNGSGSGSGSGSGKDKKGKRKSKKRGLNVSVSNIISGVVGNNGDENDILCGGDPQFSPSNQTHHTMKSNRSNQTHGTSAFQNPDDDSSLQTNPMSALFARALLNEVTDNPATLPPSEMAQREKKLLRAQEKARTASKHNLRAVGGVGSVRGHLGTLGNNASSRILSMSNGNGNSSDHGNSHANSHSHPHAPNMLSENRAQVQGEEDPGGKHRITIGLMLSRRDGKVGHKDTVTRQTAFDFNELQDRQYKYVSSTDSYGWRAGGGENGKSGSNSHDVTGSANDGNGDNINVANSMSDDTATDLDANDHSSQISQNQNQSQPQNSQNQQQPPKIAAQDTVHIPIIYIDCESSSAIDSVIAALARGEVFIPHMSILPEALGVNGISPPDLVVRFGCERSEDTTPEQWPNWCLEFMHNQLYEYFSDVGAKWMKRPFQITLAKKVRWKTMKHMNKFFSHSENVINEWRDKGPQYLDPQPSYIEGGASPEEVARPHGIYLLRNGKPTNYFAPNFEPPYTTKMTRSLLLNVMGKSWDRKRRDWSSEPIARVTTSLLLSTMCGCAEPNSGGFIAREATTAISPYSVRSRAFFGEDKTNTSSNSNSVNGISPSRVEYSPFNVVGGNTGDDNDNGSKKNTIQPQLQQKAQEHSQKLYEGLKVKREDSGIRRSRIQLEEDSVGSRNSGRNNSRNNSMNTSMNTSNMSGSNNNSANISSMSNSMSNGLNNSMNQSMNQSIDSSMNNMNSSMNDPNRSQSEGSSSRRNSRTSKQKRGAMPNSSMEHQQYQHESRSKQKQSSLGNEHHHLLEESPEPLHNNNNNYNELDSEFGAGWLSPENKFDTSTNNLDDEEFDMDMKTPSKNFFSPSEKETPLINNQYNQKNRTNFNNHAVAMEQSIPEESLARSDHHVDMNVNMTYGMSQNQGQGSVNQQDAGISVGESQTTVPIMNGSSGKFIEQERERRKERELQREKEREKIDKLERALEEKARMNQERTGSTTPQKDKDRSFNEKVSQSARYFSIFVFIK